MIILTGAGRAFCAGYDQGADRQVRHAAFRSDGQVARRIHRILAAQRRQPRRAVDAYVAAGQADHRGGQRLGHGRRLLVPARRRHHDRLRPGGVRAAGGAPHLQHDASCSARCAAGRRPTAGGSPAITSTPRKRCASAWSTRWCRTISSWNGRARWPSASRWCRSHRCGSTRPITMMGMQAAGVYSGLLLEGTLGALAHSSHNEYREAAARDPAHARAQSLSRDARRAVPARAHGPALGQGTAEEGGSDVAVCASETDGRSIRRRRRLRAPAQS